MMLTACGGGSGYDTYVSAYNKVTANGSMNADFDVSLKMDGTTTKGSGIRHEFNLHGYAGAVCGSPCAIY